MHTAIIMSRTSFDAYLHELVVLRDLERYVCFGPYRASKKDAAGNRWRVVQDCSRSIPTASSDRERFTDIYKLDFDEKLKAVISLLLIEQPMNQHADSISRFSELFWLNRVRNAIVHHHYGGRTANLSTACRNIALSAGIPPLEAETPWEELLAFGGVGSWACTIIARSILDIESFPRNRRIHFEATRDVVFSAMSSLDLRI